MLWVLKRTVSLSNQKLWVRKYLQFYAEFFCLSTPVSLIYLEGSQVRIFQIKPLKIVLFFVNSVESGDMHSVGDISVSTLFTDVISNSYSFLSEGFDSYMYPLLMTLLSYQ